MQMDGNLLSVCVKTWIPPFNPGPLKRTYSHNLLLSPLGGGGGETLFFNIYFSLKKKN